MAVATKHKPTIDTKRLAEADKLGQSPTRSFNCHGATAYVTHLADTNDLRWIQPDDMAPLLQNNTTEIQPLDIQRGDILALFDSRHNDFDKLIHTATYLGQGNYWHKRGSAASEHTTLSGVIDTYNEYVHLQHYRRKDN